MQDRIKSALFLDFDNIFGGLHALDAEQADDMADQPWQWLENVLEQVDSEGKRDVLVKRAYLNPAGRIKNGDGTWRYFSSIRPQLTRAGFEIIDCPSLTSSGKNAADIRIVMDVLAYLDRSCRYDEFIIASSDADFTPLLYRLRAEDRRATVIASGQTSAAYQQVADAVLDVGELLEAGILSASEIGEKSGQVSLPAASPVIHEKTRTEQESAAVTTATSCIEASDEPVLLSTFAKELRDSLEPSKELDNWFGYRTFGKFVQSISDKFVIEGHHVWDTTRHGMPVDRDISLPDTIRRICNETNLPRLSTEKWEALFVVMAQYAQENDFNLTHCTAWCRDKLRDQDIAIGRVQISYVVRSSVYGGQPLNSIPSPSDTQIRDAVLRAAVARAQAVHLTLTEEEEAELSDWMGGI